MSYIKDQDTFSNDYAIFTSDPIVIDTTPIGTYTLMTWNRPNKRFCPTRISFVLTAKGATSFTTTPTAVIGTNATSYNNIVNSSATTLDFDNTTSNINTVGQFNTKIVNLIQSTTGIVPVNSGQSIVLNVLGAGAGGSDHTIVFTIEGFCIPV